MCIQATPHSRTCRSHVCPSLLGPLCLQLAHNQNAANVCRGPNRQDQFRLPHAAQGRTDHTGSMEVILIFSVGRNRSKEGNQETAGIMNRPQESLLCTYRTVMSTARIESALAALQAERQALEVRLEELDAELAAEDAKAEKPNRLVASNRRRKQRPPRKPVPPRAA